MSTLPELIFQPHRILVPLDFSDPSRKALRAAIGLAEGFESRLAVVHVTRLKRPDSHVTDDPLGARLDTRETARARLARWIEREVPCDLEVTRIVTDGVPFDRIVRAAQAWEADLIVIATHGYTGLKHVVLGSTAERVVRHAPCPVLTVRSRETRGVKTAFIPARLRSILAPVDFSKSSLDALPVALALARRYGARLTLVHVLEPFHADLFLDASQAQRDARLAAHERLAAIASAAKKAWPRAGRELRSGLPVATITALAKRTNADLIVLGTHGRTGPRHSLIGNIAERVVRHAPCPVLTVRPKAR